MTNEQQGHRVSELAALEPDSTLMSVWLHFSPFVYLSMCKLHNIATEDGCI
jgi:hypothetical protein